MNRNAARWSLLLPVFLLGCLALTFWQSGGTLATAAPDAAPNAQATATSTSTPTNTATPTNTPGPAQANLGGVNIYAPHASGGGNLLGVSIEHDSTGGGGGAFPVGTGTALPVGGAANVGTPVAANPIRMGVDTYTGNMINLHAAPIASGDNVGDSVLQVGARLQAQGNGTSAMTNLQANATTGALLVQGATPLPTWTAQPLLAVGTPLVADSAGRLNTVPYVINGSGAIDQVQGGRFLTTPVATATGFQNVLAGGVTRLTPITMTNAQVANLSLDSNGNLSVAQGVALPAGEAHLGAVGGNTLHPSANPALSVAASYVSGDYVGTSATPWSWTGCRTATGTGQLQSVTVIDKAIQSVAGELWLFDRSVTVPNDSVAWTITDADAQFLLGVVPVSTYYASAANSVASVTGVGMTLWCNGSSTIYGAWVTRGSPSYASGDLTVVLGISAD